MKGESSISKTISLYTQVQRPRSARTERVNHTPSFKKTSGKASSNALNNSYNNFHKFSVMLPKTIPNKVEKEHFYMENLSLKADIQNLQNDIAKYKSIQKLHDVELSKRDKEINELFKTRVSGKNSEELAGKEGYYQNINYCQLYRKYKNKYKKVKVELAERGKELQDLKCQLKFTKVSEFSIQNKILMEEIEKYKNLLTKAEQINQTQQKYLENILVEKQQNAKNVDMEKSALTLKVKELEKSLKLCNDDKEIKQFLRTFNSEKIFPITATTGFGNTGSPLLMIQTFTHNYDPALDETRRNIQSEKDSPINQRISALLKENKSLDSELKRIKNLSRELLAPENFNTSTIDQRDLNNSKNRLDKSMRVSSSLKDIEKYHLTDEKFIQTISVMLKAILHSQNYTYSKFEKLIMKENITDPKVLSKRLFKFFHNIYIVNDFEDLFSIHSLVTTILREIDFSSDSAVLSALKKKLFTEDPLEVSSMINTVYELKRVSST